MLINIHIYLILLLHVSEESITKKASITLTDLPSAPSYDDEIMTTDTSTLANCSRSRELEYPRSREVEHRRSSEEERPRSSQVERPRSSEVERRK